MKIALWDEPAAGLFAAGLATVPGLSLTRASRQACEDLLRDGEVDVALVQTLSVLRNTDTFDVYPAVALSSWRYPYARLVLPGGLGQPVASLAFNPEHAQEAFMAGILLKEHYGARATPQPHVGLSAEELLDIPADAILLVGDEAPGLTAGGVTLDLGEEWYELVQYPMVWGLFAVRKDEGTADGYEALKAGIEAAERLRDSWPGEAGIPTAIHDFFREDLRLRLDDLVVAGMTQLREYLFFYGLTPDIPDAPFCTLVDEDEEQEASGAR